MSDRNKYRSNKFTPAQREEQKIQALRMWMTGAGYEDIAEAIGTSMMTAYNRVQKAIDDMRPHADYDKYRSIQLAELEMMRRPMRKVIATFGTQGGSNMTQAVKAVTSLIRIQEREARLLGLDRMPSPFDEFSNMSDDELAAQVSEMANEMQAKSVDV